MPLTVPIIYLLIDTLRGKKRKTLEEAIYFTTDKLTT